MDVYEKLEELQEKALHDDTIRKTLLKTREEKEPILAFCKQCQELGYEIYPMELINAGRRILRNNEKKYEWWRRELTKIKW